MIHNRITEGDILSSKSDIKDSQYKSGKAQDTEDLEIIFSTIVPDTSEAVSDSEAIRSLDAEYEEFEMRCALRRGSGCGHGVFSDPI